MPNHKEAVAVCYDTINEQLDLMAKLIDEEFPDHGDPMIHQSIKGSKISTDLLYRRYLGMIEERDGK